MKTLQTIMFVILSAMFVFAIGCGAAKGKATASASASTLDADAGADASVDTSDNTSPSPADNTSGSAPQPPANNGKHIYWQWVQGTCGDFLSQQRYEEWAPFGSKAMGLMSQIPLAVQQWYPDATLKLVKGPLPANEEYVLIIYYCERLQDGEVTFIHNRLNVAPTDAVMKRGPDENWWQFYKKSAQQLFAPAPVIPSVVPVPPPQPGPTASGLASPPPPAPGSAPAPAAAPAAQPTSMTIDRNLFLTGLNDYRASHQLQPVAYQSQLDSASQAWAEYNRDKRFVEPKHRHKGSTCATRATAAGYIASDVGENLSRSISPEANHVLIGWQNSPPHNAALLDPVYTEIGLACVDAPVGEQVGPYICVLMLAKPALAPVVTPTAAVPRVPVVVLYTINGCPACETARQLLQTNNISYTEKNVENDAAAMNEFKKKARKQGVSVRGFPMLEINDQLLPPGSSPAAIQAALNNSPSSDGKGGGKGKGKGKKSKPTTPASPPATSSAT